MISNTLVEFFFLLIQVYQQQQLDQIDKKRQKKTPRKTTITLTAKNLGLTVTPRISRSVTSLYLLLSLFSIHTLTHTHTHTFVSLSLSLFLITFFFSSIAILMTILDAQFVLAEKKRSKCLFQVFFSISLSNSILKSIFFHFIFSFLAFLQSF